MNEIAPRSKRARPPNTKMIPAPSSPSPLARPRSKYPLPPCSTSSALRTTCPSSLASQILRSVCPVRACTYTATSARQSVVRVARSGPNGNSDTEIRARLRQLLECLPGGAASNIDLYAPEAAGRSSGRSHKQSWLVSWWGIDSNLPVMLPTAHILNHFRVPYELMILSAHRTPTD